jgi:uncharacterized protein YkwD
MVAKVNEVRQRHGLRPLRPSGSLDGSSARYARRLMRTDTLAHRARPSVAGHYRRAGEVLAYRSGSGPGISWTIRAWMRSSTHRSVLLASSMRDMGAGLARGRFRGRRAVVWVLQVGR